MDLVLSSSRPAAAAAAAALTLFAQTLGITTMAVVVRCWEGGNGTGRWPTAAARTVYWNKEFQ